MKLRPFLLAPMFLSAATLAALAQVAPVNIGKSPAGRVIRRAAAPTSSPNPADVAKKAASAVGLGSARGVGPLLVLSSAQIGFDGATATPSPRLARLTQLQFDRRPSTILKTWAGRTESKTTPTKEPAKDSLTVELETFQKHVTLGNWPAVKVYLAGLPAAESKAAYQQLLQSLQNNPVTPGARINQPRMIMGPDGQMQMFTPETHSFSVEDVIGLAAAAPGGLDQQRTAGLGAILKRALEGNTVVPDVVAHFHKEVEKGAGKAAFTKRQAAQLLMEANQPVGAGEFLPGLDKAITDKDSEGLNLVARYFLGVYEREKRRIDLEQAWSATQAILTLKDGKSADKEEALRRAVELAPKIKEELGQAWLDQSFTNHPERGMDILAAIGSLASQGLDTKTMEREERLKTLQLLKSAVDALLKAAPQLAAQWHDKQALLAVVWMREADYTKQWHITQSNNTGRRSRRIMYYDDSDLYFRQRNQPLPIHTAELLRTRPDKGWFANLDKGSRAKLAALLAHLYLKVDDEKMAFLFIEELAPTNKEETRDLVNEFLGVWTTNHDPNPVRQSDTYLSTFYINGVRYVPSSGGSADGIPLTRSKQDRNLEDLADWVTRMRKLPLDRLDEDLLVNAFTKCHSRAEVYRLDAIEKVFGPIAKIKPRTLATLIQNTRSNLAGVWRIPAEQQKNKTNRKPKDIEAEVLKGYELAGNVVSNALKQFPEDWSLNLARAALLHDETNYRQEVAKSSDYSTKREQAIANFHKAAALYADQVRKLSEDEETIAVYEQWFYASLGACDLREIDGDKLPDSRQAALIRKALLALPREVAERHMNKMAESLVANLSVVNPAIRYRYLKHGFEIVGDNKQAAAAKKVFDYYNDLVKEIKLDVVIDGSDKVGHGQPFGIFVNIRHTREIEREAGGFGQFLQNQSTPRLGYYVRGPAIDYRDRFEAAATEALKEQFEIVSKIYQTSKIHSRAAPDYGWRITPYAYLLLKPRGPQVDKIPPLRFDFAFEDNMTDYSDNQRATGYVVLPIESPPVPIDANSERGEPRPVRKLQITQILDERKADLGKLGLEIRAKAVGLVGPMDEILSLAPDGFEVAKIDDPNVSVAEFDKEGDDIAVVSERTWLVDLRAKQDRAAAPTNFRFASPKIETAEMVYQRYQDADLVPAEQEVTLEHEYRGRGKMWFWIAGTATLVLVGILLLAIVLVFRRRPQKTAGMQLPQTITPFTVLALLRRIQQTGNLGSDDKTALDHAMADLESRFFAEATSNGEINLRTLAEDWVRKVNKVPPNRRARRVAKMPI